MQVYKFPRRVLSESQLSIEQQLANAFEQGMKEGERLGFERGQQQVSDELRLALEQEKQSAIASATQEVSARLTGDLQAQFNQLLEQWQAEKAKMTANLQAGVLALVTGLARSVLDAELAIEPMQMQRVVQQAISDLQNQDEIQEIRISEHDEPIWQQLDITHLAGIPLQSYPELAAGEVHFIGKEQLHVISLQARLDELLAQVKSGLADDVKIAG